MPGLGSASGLVGRFDRPELFYDFTSPLYPSTTFLYDAKANKGEAFNPPKLTFDPAPVRDRARVLHEQGRDARADVHHASAESREGRKQPDDAVRVRRLLDQRDGRDSALTSSPGSSRAACMPSPTFAAAANTARSGIDAGQFERKQNVFDDFIGGGEYLIKEKYTSPAKLAINGGSNGGLLVGAVMTQRPELFGVAVPQVGVHGHAALRRSSPAAPRGRPSTARRRTRPRSSYLRAYSPLQNMKAGVCYPATLVTTADHDDRVVPSHSYKFAATMQKEQSAASGCGKPVLLRVEAQGSHGYRPLDRRIAELADIWAFAAYHLGMTVRQQTNIVQ